MWKFIDFRFLTLIPDPDPCQCYHLPTQPPRMSHRPLQIAGIIRSVVARHALTIQPNIATMVSITDVRLSTDFSYADISVTALSNVDAAVAALKRGSTQMREEVGKVVTMHKLPMLRFQRDDAIEKGEKIDQLLAQISTPPKKAVRRVVRRKK